MEISTSSVNVVYVVCKECRYSTQCPGDDVLTQCPECGNLMIQVSVKDYREGCTEAAKFHFEYVKARVRGRIENAAGFEESQRILNAIVDNHGKPLIRMLKAVWRS